MKSFLKRAIALWLALLFVLTPRMIQLALAQDDSDSASDEEIQEVRQLAQAGYLGDKKDFFLSAKSLAEDDITDALVAIDAAFSQVDLKSLKPGNSQYQTQDLEVILKLLKEKTDDIRARKVSAWKFENRVKKMIAALTSNGEAASPATTAVPTKTPAPKPTPTPTPIPVPSMEEFNGMKKSLKDLEKKTDDYQTELGKKYDLLNKNQEDLQKSQEDLKGTNADNQEQLKLVKKLIDEVRENLKKTGDRLDQVAQKTNQKNITDTELEQDLNILHKDLRDNVQDVSVLKQQIAKMESANSNQGASPLDQVLNSKWLAGGALVVGLAALIVTLTRK